MAATMPTPGSICTLVALRASQVSVVACPRLSVVGFALKVIVGAGGGGGGGAGAGGGGGGGGAVFLWHAKANSTKSVRNSNPNFRIREELIAKPPCRNPSECTRTMPVMYFFRCLSVAAPSCRPEASSRSEYFHSSTIQRQYVFRQVPIWAFHYLPHHA